MLHLPISRLILSKKGEPFRVVEKALLKWCDLKYFSEGCFHSDCDVNMCYIPSLLPHPTTCYVCRMCAFLWELLLVLYAVPSVRYIGKTVLTVVVVDGSIYLSTKSTCPFPFKLLHTFSLSNTFQGSSTK